MYKLYIGITNNLSAIKPETCTKSRISTKSRINVMPTLNAVSLCKITQDLLNAKKLRLHWIMQRVWSSSWGVCEIAWLGGVTSNIRYRNNGSNRFRDRSMVPFEYYMNCMVYLLNRDLFEPEMNKRISNWVLLIYGNYGNQSIHCTYFLNEFSGLNIYKCSGHSFYIRFIIIKCYTRWSNGIFVFISINS